MTRWILHPGTALPEDLRVGFEADLAADRSRGEFRAFGDLEVYAKSGPLRGKAPLRHAARRLWPGLDVPRLQEAANLRWLAEQGFGAAEPLAAGFLSRRGLPVFQFLFTARIRGAVNLRDLLEDPSHPERPRALALAALEIGRLHGSGFVHRDLFPRNLLFVPGTPPRLVFLDCWRGGPGRGLRPPAFDLAAFFLQGARLLEPHEQRAFLEAYSAAREVAGGKSLGERERIAVARARAGLRQRWLRGRRGEETPPEHWAAPPR